MLWLLKMKPFWLTVGFALLNVNITLHLAYPASLQQYKVLRPRGETEGKYQKVIELSTTLNIVIKTCEI